MEEEKWVIELIDGVPRNYVDSRYFNVGNAFFENYIEVSKNEVDMARLTTYKLIDGKLQVSFDLNKKFEDNLRQFLLNVKLKELSKLKIQYSEKEFIYSEKYVQKNRELDKNNLNNIVTALIVTNKTSFEGWKFKDLEGNDVYVTLTMQDILNIFTTMTKQTTKAMHIETNLRDRINIMSIEDLNNFNPQKEFEILWNN